MITRQLPSGHLGGVFIETRDRAEHLGFWLTWYRDDGWRYTPTVRATGAKRSLLYLALAQAHLHRTERERR
ncbi:hypothetical protein GCM10009799_22060 [Nocardiopsis rhodophaea]|uniref:Uncharacterized protein n=1 Tax=Nocardiopsis rhodophaea TaxID=280238 RepID=A0ABN2SZF2_9ACTN